MRALLVSWSDYRGGAAIAARRLHDGLLRAGVDTAMLVQDKGTDARTIHAPDSPLAKAATKPKPIVATWPLLLYRRREPAMFSPEWLPDRVPRAVAGLSPDVVNLHWICNGFVRIESLGRIGLPLVWTLHDMWPFTGGCHYSGDCARFRERCGSCPVLGSRLVMDLSRLVWLRKRRVFDRIDLTVVAPSRWMAERARESSLFLDMPVEVIPNGLDIERFRPFDKASARDLLGLPKDKRLVLFGGVSATSDPRKGYDLLEEALRRLPAFAPGTAGGTELVVFGASSGGASLPLPTRFLGRFGDDVSLALVYAAADVFVAPSRSDNLPNTLLEALSCGTPCVAFDAGGIPDLVEHQANGYLARAGDAEDLARGMAWILADGDRLRELGAAARRKITSGFSLEHQAARYRDLFAWLAARRAPPLP